MNKFLKIMLIVMLLFICVVSVQYIMKTKDKEDVSTQEEAEISPEQLQLQTMTSISDIVLSQLLDNAILNIDLTPVKDKQDVVLYLQASEFLDEETILKDSYNLLKEIQHVKSVNDFTLKWLMLIRNTNTEVLTLSFDSKTLASINDVTYNQLPQLAKRYEKHASLEQKR